jgi:hypothetical protein
MYKQALVIYDLQLGADNESTVAILRALGDLPPEPVGAEQNDYGYGGETRQSVTQFNLTEENFPMPGATAESTKSEADTGLGALVPPLSTGVEKEIVVVPEKSEVNTEGDQVQAK